MKWTYEKIMFLAGSPEAKVAEGTAEQLKSLTGI